MMRAVRRSLVGSLLLVASIVCALACYFKYCEIRRLSAPPSLRSSHVVRWLFERSDYRRLLAVLAAEQSERFQTLWDTNADVALDSRQFEAVDMFGATRYRYRPNLRLVDFAVWTGLQIRSFGALQTPALERALEDCRLIRRTSFETDALGLRRTQFALDGAQPTLMFLGDSFTAGLHVRAEDTFANLFGAEMQAAGIRAVPVNAGVDGYGAHEYAWTAQYLAGALKPRVVILSLYANDAHENDLAVIRNAIPARRYVEMFSHLDRLAETCRSQGQRLLVSVIPHKEEVRAERTPGHFQRRVARWCASRRLPFLDPLDVFRAAGADALYLSWDPHLSEQGHRVYATFLFQRALSALREVY